MTRISQVGHLLTDFPFPTPIAQFLGIRRRFEMGTPFLKSCRTKLFRALSETETKGIIENRHDGVNRQTERKASC